MKTMSIYLLLTLTALSCKKDDNPVVVQPKPDVIVPLDIGNQWTYKRTTYDSTGAITRVDTFTNKVLRDTVIQSESWAFLSYWGTAYKNRSDGCWYMLLEPTLVYKYPAMVNDFFLRGQDTVRVVSTNSLASVPLGTFSCYDYQSTFFGLTFHALVAPKIGVIKDEGVMRVNNGNPFVFSRSELINCVLR